ncbi:M15 family metallopeptidase [Candidatus Microgenomates bacterium]|nr:M15 family metallopeptidase [Candidatus Microgenomates bacterium]
MKITLLIVALLIFGWTLKTIQPQDFHKAVAEEFVVPDQQPPKVLAEQVCNSNDSLDILIDKFHGLSPNYVPPDLVDISNFKLRPEAANALNTLMEKMGQSNLFAAINSAYRSFDDQKKLFKPGDNISAQPGFSEHQLGTAVDLNLAYPSPTWTWLDKNAHKYGFVMSYRYGQTINSGYSFEPWHWRYVGAALATQIRASKNSPQSFYKPGKCN